MPSIHSITRIARTAVSARRFVDVTGAHAASSLAAIGISEQGASIGEAFSAVTYYSAPVEAAEALAVGDLVKPAADGSGRAAKSAAGDCCGRVMEAAAAAGKFAEVRFLDIPAGGAVSVGVSTTAVAASRASLASDSGATLELASGVTYTLDGTALHAGVVLMGPASGSANLAVSGAATINGGIATVTVGAGQIYSAISRATAPAAFVVKGS